jgi:hypothetical protein
MYKYQSLGDGMCKCNQKYKGQYIQNFQSKCVCVCVKVCQCVSVCVKQNKKKQNKQKKQKKNNRTITSFREMIPSVNIKTTDNNYAGIKDSYSACN